MPKCSQYHLTNEVHLQFAAHTQHTVLINIGDGGRCVHIELSAVTRNNHIQDTAIQSKLSTHNKLLTNFPRKCTLCFTVDIFRTHLPVKVQGGVSGIDLTCDVRRSKWVISPNSLVYSSLALTFKGPFLEKC